MAGTHGQRGLCLRIQLAMNPLLKLALEIGPLVVFFLTNTQMGIFNATIAFMVATAIALALSYAINRTIPTMPLVTAVFVMFFGGLTIWLQDETFIKVKPTIVNLLFATILAFGLMTGRLFLKMVLDSAFAITDIGWVKMTRAWVGFFICLAILNEIVWRTVSTDTWVTFKVFGVMPLTLVFSFSLVPIISKYALETPEDSPPQSKEN
jgi:intracellular septation protein